MYDCSLLFIIVYIELVYSGAQFKFYFESVSNLSLNNFQGLLLQKCFTFTSLNIKSEKSYNSIDKVPAKVDFMNIIFYDHTINYI